MFKLYQAIPLLFLISCAVATEPNNSTLSTHTQQRDLANTSKHQTGSGFINAEAQQLLEFCIELNNQDYRLTSDNKDFRANGGDWTIVYDSRHPGNTEWNKKWPYSGPVDDKINPNNPQNNGFKPFNNAWLLLQSKNKSEYAIAIRGTVKGLSSLAADALLSTIPAQAGIKNQDGKTLPITFAQTEKAELHIGFAYAAFTMLFDKEHGIISQLQKLDIKPTKLFITGHSQGAAIATIINSFLYYAITDPSDRYQLNLKLNQGNNDGVQLKSYIFAQPKPGNLQYAQDVAKISQDMFFTVNNVLDPVQQIPLTIQLPSEVLNSVSKENLGKGNWEDELAFNALYKVSNVFKVAREKIAGLLANQVEKHFNQQKLDLNLEPYFPTAQVATTQPTEKANSQNYTLAGQLVPVFGLYNGGNLYPGDEKADILLQHHATSYRKLLAKQLP